MSFPWIWYRSGKLDHGSTVLSILLCQFHTVLTEHTSDLGAVSATVRLLGKKETSKLSFIFLWLRKASHADGNLGLSPK